MSMYGADVDELRRLERLFITQTERLENEVLRPVDHLVSSSPWKGRDADAFRQRWVQDARTLVSVMNRLQGVAIRLRAEAREQERASSVQVSSGYISVAEHVARSLMKVEIDLSKQVFEPEGGTDIGSDDVKNTTGNSEDANQNSPGNDANEVQGALGGRLQTSINAEQCIRTIAFSAFESLHPAGSAPVEYNRDGAEFQCVDFVQAYAAHLFGVPAHLTTGRGNAHQIFENSSSQYFDKISVGQRPEVGDIVCVGSNVYSSYGHVAIVKEVRPDGGIVVLEQDGGALKLADRAPRLRTLTLQENAAIQGFLRPKTDKLSSN